MANRRTNRIVAGIGVIVEIGGKSLPCLTGNLSTGGVYVMLRHHAAVGDEVVVSVPDGAKKLRARAVVASNDGRGLGLRIVEDTPGFAESWERLIKRMLRRSTQDIKLIPQEEIPLEGDLAWANMPDGKLWNPFKKRVHTDPLTNLSMDGAAFSTRTPPSVGQSVLIFLFSGEGQRRQEFHCQAEVVRHTADGFAVRFDSPRLEFRRALSRLRRTKNIGDA